MKKLISATPFIGILVSLSSTPLAAAEPSVPEIDAGTSAIAVGLTVGVVALIREYRRRK